MAEVLTIDDLRNRIDTIDEQLVRLLNVRVACAVEVGRLKHEAGLPIYQPDREAHVLARVRASAIELAGPLEAEAVVRIFERVIDEARRAERIASEHRLQRAHTETAQTPSGRAGTGHGDAGE